MQNSKGSAMDGINGRDRVSSVMGRGSLPLSRGSAPGKELVSNFHGLRHAREDTVVAR